MPPEHSTGIAGLFLRVGLRTMFDRATDFVRRHVVEQDGLGSVRERLFHLIQVTHFDLDGLRATAIAMARSSAGTMPPASAM